MVFAICGEASYIRSAAGRGAVANGAAQVKEEPLDTGEESSVGRLSWEQAHRLELTLQARASRLSGQSAGRCPECGRQVAPSEAQLRLGEHVVHTGCLREDAPV
jgi:hypothetical protein